MANNPLKSFSKFFEHILHKKKKANYDYLFPIHIYLFTYKLYNHINVLYTLWNKFKNRNRMS